MKPKISVQRGKTSKPTSASTSDPASQSTVEIDLTYGRHAVLAALKGDRQINQNCS